MKRQAVKKITKSQAAFSLVETMIALTLLATGILAVIEANQLANRSVKDASNRLDWNDQINDITAVIGNQGSCQWAITHGSPDGTSPLVFDSANPVFWSNITPAAGASPVAIAMVAATAGPSSTGPSGASSTSGSVVASLTPPPGATTIIGPSGMYFAVTPPNVSPMQIPGVPKYKIYPALLTIQGTGKSSTTSNSGGPTFRQAHMALNIVTDNATPPNIVSCFGGNTQPACAIAGMSQTCAVAGGGGGGGGGGQNGNGGNGPPGPGGPSGPGAPGGPSGPGAPAGPSSGNNDQCPGGGSPCGGVCCASAQICVDPSSPVANGAFACFSGCAYACKIKIGPIGAWTLDPGGSVGCKALRPCGAGGNGGFLGGGSGCTPEQSYACSHGGPCTCK